MLSGRAFATHRGVTNPLPSSLASGCTFMGAVVLATYMPFCNPPVHPTVQPADAQRKMAELWNQPGDMASRDLFNGPWSARHAPDPHATYTFLKPKAGGTSPGLHAVDPDGLEWSVKQGPESNVEVTFSRVLSALGYHQPPVYYLPSFTLRNKDGAKRTERGGRFRPHLHALKDVGEWSWQANPFVGLRPYQGLLVVQMLFNASDIKNSNTTMYELSEPREGATRWYALRDIGTALGDTARGHPAIADVDKFERYKFISGLYLGFVQFNYHGWHQELFTDRITPEDVRWTCELAGQLADAQWADAFRAGGFEPEKARRFIARLKEKIAEGKAIREQ